MLRQTLAVLFALALVTSPVLSQTPADFERAGAEAADLLRDLIRIDTSNPPGNETLVAEYVKDVLEAEGLSGEIFALDPSRGNLVVRLEGNGNREPILIMAHSDVVGVELDSWTTDPFGGEVQDDGYMYGRGARDDKGMIAAGAQVLRMIKRAGLTLDRDVILLIEAGEEGTTEFGIDFMMENHLDEIRAEFALNEGGGMHMTADGTVDRVNIGTAEKVPWRRIRLVARGTAGHGSIPRVDNPVVHLAQAVAKLGNFQMPSRLNETTREYFRRLAENSPPDQAFFYRNVEDPELGPMVEEYFRHEDPFSNSLLRTSISPNVIEGGFRFNVIPSDAEATLDVRALPDEDMESFLAELVRVIDDPAVEVVPPVSWRPSAPPSPLDTDLFRALEENAARMFEGVSSTPYMSTGATDSAQLRAAGIPAYGVGIPATDDDGRAHGNDERVSLAGLNLFVEFLYRTILDVSGGRRGTD